MVISRMVMQPARSAEAVTVAGNPAVSCGPQGPQARQAEAHADRPQPPDRTEQDHPGIHTSDDDRICYIDPGECIGCNLCLGACPVGAIFTADGALPAPGAWTDLNALWFDDRKAARARVDELSQPPVR